MFDRKENIKVIDFSPFDAFTASYIHYCLFSIFISLVRWVKKASKTINFH